MKFGPVLVDQAEGKTLGHHISGPQGGHLFRKGKPLQAADIEALRALGKRSVYVAELEPGDVSEDVAAARVARAASSGRLEATRANVGRVNLQARCLGVLQVDARQLMKLNEIEGVTIATRAAHWVAQPGQAVATIKIIPFAMPEVSVAAAEALAAEGGALLDLLPLVSRSVAILLAGAPQARQRVVETFEGPLRARVEALGSRVSQVEFVPIEEEASGEEFLLLRIRWAAEAGADLIVLGGDTAIMDRHDMAPRAIEALGGQVIQFGAPVDPGNLLLLAYLGELPILGVPGCARSRKPNVIDWVLPRLLAGERLARTDLLALGYGGLLDGVQPGVSWRDRLVDG